jgi:hypothetical protein
VKIGKWGKEWEAEFVLKRNTCSKKITSLEMRIFFVVKL